MDVYSELLKHEIGRGEKISWVFRWVVYGVSFLLTVMVLVLQRDIVGFYGMCLTGTTLLYNAFLTYYIQRDRTDTWIRYTSVTIDIVFLTLYNALDAYSNSTLVPVTTATLLLYPVIIFLASLRQDRHLIVYATILTAVCMNILFAFAWPHFDRAIASKLICGNILGEVYRTAYILLFGFLLLIIPRTIDRLLTAQKTMIEHNMENFRKAHHDILTGLANRRLLIDFLEKAIPLAERNKSVFAVIYLDLDGFKPVNDTLGHDAGDQVLVEVGQRILSVVRESDLVARVGGDEFVAIAQVDSRNGAEAVARRILEAIRAPLVVEHHSFPLGASIGIAMFPDHGSDPEGLVQIADEAMYRIKKTGKNSIGFVS
jgi:diguanylate cyclase (GGDEF)-like protein